MFLKRSIVQLFSFFLLFFVTFTWKTFHLNECSIEVFYLKHLHLFLVIFWLFFRRVPVYASHNYGTIRRKHLLNFLYIITHIRCRQNANSSTIYFFYRARITTINWLFSCNYARLPCKRRNNGSAVVGLILAPTIDYRKAGKLRREICDKM